MFPIFLVVIGAFAIYAGISMVVRGASVRSWPTVAGRIVERGIGPRTFASGGGGTGRTFEPKIKYAYRVGERDFVGTRIGPANAAYDESTARRVVAKLPEQVTVHYDARDPSESYLEATSIGVAVLALAGGVVALLLAVGLFFASKS